MGVKSFLVLSSLLAGLVAIPGHALAQQKSVSACEAEWRANKAANQAQGITEKAYVTQCRAASAQAPGGATSAAPAPSGAANAPAAPAAKATTAAPAAAPTAAPRATRSAPSGAGQFTAEAQAKANCPADTVVWANLSSKIYHFAGYKDYGTTKNGAFMCEREATAQGFRAAKTEKHPA